MKSALTLRVIFVGIMFLGTIGVANGKSIVYYNDYTTASDSKLLNI